MYKKSSIKPLAAAIGTAVLTSLAAMPVAQADASPFGMTDLGSGYQVAQEGKCGEGKCGGAAKKPAAEGKCGEGKCGGAAKKPVSEGKCGGAAKKPVSEGKCGGAAKKPVSEGKCGEGKCGGSK